MVASNAITITGSIILIITNPALALNIIGKNLNFWGFFKKNLFVWLFAKVILDPPSPLI